ncbi:MAG: cupin domain-containing protein [Sediminicola sp.]|tara:strand:+ start:176989 stop:177327 length:339 start_codon:yes stop_codon:yes gene_type:complete
MKLVRTELLPEMGVSHNPAIKKKVFLEKGEIPQLMNFGTAVFKSEQRVETHSHPSMFEIFYVLEGRIEFVVENEQMVLRAGDCISISPKEAHSQYNPFHEEAKLLYYGIAVD